MKIKKFTLFLAIISIIGFTAILLQPIVGFSLSDYQNALMLIVFGTGLLIVGNFKMLLHYISDGKLTEREVMHIVTSVVGLFALVAGLLTLPEVDVVFPAFEGIKMLIAFIAIIFIIVEMVVE